MPKEMEKRPNKRTNLKAKIARLHECAAEARVRRKMAAEDAKNGIHTCNDYGSVNAMIRNADDRVSSKIDDFLRPITYEDEYEEEDIVKTEVMDTMDIKEELEFPVEFKDEVRNYGIFTGNKNSSSQSGPSTSSKAGSTLTRMKSVKSAGNKDVDSIIELLYYLERYGTIIVTEDNESNIRENIHLYFASKTKVPQKSPKRISPLVNSNRRMKNGGDHINVDVIENSRLSFPDPDLETEYSKLNPLPVKSTRKSKLECRRYNEDLLFDVGLDLNKPQPEIANNQLNPNSLFLCDTCGKAFKKVGDLKLHGRIHVPGPKYLCEICPKAFRQLGGLRLHKRLHTGETPYICEVCGMRFSRDKNYGNHIATHSDERNFKCKICPKTFRRSDHLEFHMRIHSGDKRYKCKPCNKSFVQIGSLIFHNKTHHTSTLLNNLLIL